MTARFLGCAPLDFGGDALTIFGPSRKPVTWQGFYPVTANWAFYQRTLATDGKGKFIVGNNHYNYQVESDDGGASWVLKTVGGLSNNVISDSLAYGNGLWVFASAGLGFYSTDGGANWKPSGQYVVSPFGNDAYIAYGNGIWAAIGASQCVYNTNPTGQAWTASAYTLSSIQYQHLIFDPVNGVFVAYATPTGGSASIITSPDGNTWTAYPMQGGGTAYSLSSGAGICAAVSSASAPRIRVGSTWADIAAGTDIAVPFHAGDATVSGLCVTAERRIVCLGNLGSVSTSVDNGATWVEDAVPWGNNGSTPTAPDNVALADGANAVSFGFDYKANLSVCMFRLGLC